jgi:hypothetical protein
MSSQPSPEFLMQIQTRRNHFLRLGIKPNRLYLGKLEMEILNRLIETCTHKETLKASAVGDPVIFCDLTVCPVEDESYLAVGLVLER